MHHISQRRKSRGKKSPLHIQTYLSCITTQFYALNFKFAFRPETTWRARARARFIRERCQLLFHSAPPTRLSTCRLSNDAYVRLSHISTVALASAQAAHIVKHKKLSITLLNLCLYFDHYRCVVEHCTRLTACRRRSFHVSFVRMRTPLQSEL